MTGSIKCVNFEKHHKFSHDTYLFKGVIFHGRRELHAYLKEWK